MALVLQCADRYRRWQSIADVKPYHFLPSAIKITYLIECPLSLREDQELTFQLVAECFNALRVPYGFRLDEFPDRAHLAQELEVLLNVEKKSIDHLGFGDGIEFKTFYHALPERLSHHVDREGPQYNGRNYRQRKQRHHNLRAEMHVLQPAFPRVSLILQSLTFAEMGYLAQTLHPNARKRAPQSSGPHPNPATKKLTTPFS